MNGTIIAIVGGPRSGKSFLVQKLAEHYEAEAFLEGEEGDFPERIIEDIEQNIRPLERVLWFRTMLVERYLEAQALRDAGKTVVLDGFWACPQAYIDTLAEGFERELLWDVARQDAKLLGWPDVTVLLTNSESSIRHFIELGGRSFDRSESYIQELAFVVARQFADHFGTHQEGPVLTIERSDMDFARTDDLKHVIAMIEEVRGN